MNSGPEDPQVVSNPPGLTQIAYRADDFTGFRRALLRPLPGEQAIGPWRPAPGDLGLQVLEWWAYLGDVLTFYNERIANESYLRTAIQPGSIANLVALLGYQPAPGLAATGTIAALRSAAYPAEPLVIPAGLAVSSAASAGVPSQTFEVGAAASFAGPSSLPVALPPGPALGVGAGSEAQWVLLGGPVSGVGAGDRLLLAAAGFAGQDDNWSLVTVGSVTPVPDPATGAANTLIGFSASTRGPASAAPLLPQASYQLLRPSGATALWNRGAPVGGEPVVAPAVTAQNSTVLAVHLSAAVRGISPGDTVLFDCGTTAPSALASVTGTAEALWAVPYPSTPGVTAPSPPNIVIPHTVLTVATVDAAALEQADPATVTVRYGFTDVGTLTGLPAATLASLPVTAAVPSAPPLGSTAFLQDATGAGVLVTVADAGPGQVTLAGAGTPPSAITTPLAVPLQLLTSLLPVSRGTTVTGEILGSGSAALASQSFTLANSPLTYLAGTSGPVSTLAVYVDGVQWHEVPSFYGQAADARVFTVSRSPDQAVTTVTFGDGINGARLTSGSGNVTASYRYGSGAASPPAGRLTTILKPQPNLASLQNPVAVSGGADPQAPADVRANAPASVLTFGRAISADDYETIAAQVPGVTRVAASWTLSGQRGVATVYVDGGQAAAAAANAALAGAGAPSGPVLVIPATLIEVSLSCTLVVAADAVVAATVTAAAAAVTDPVTGPFSPARQGIGQRLYRSAIDAALMVPGVAAVHDLTVSWTGQALGEFADPGQGSFFDLPAANVTIGGTSASG
jgi:Baseplate J-like protein